MFSYRSNCSAYSLGLKKEARTLSKNVQSSSQKSFLFSENDAKHCDTSKNISPFVINEIKKPSQHSKIIERIKMKCLIEASISPIDCNVSQKENNSLQLNSQSKINQFLSDVINTNAYPDSVNGTKRIEALKEVRGLQCKKKEIIDMLCPGKGGLYLTARQSKGNQSQGMPADLGKSDIKEFFNEFKKRQSKTRESQYEAEKAKQKRIANSSLSKLTLLKSQLEKTSTNPSTQGRALIYSKSHSTLIKNDLKSLSRRKNETEIKEFKRDFKL